MANTKQAEKRIQQNEKKRRHNASMRSTLRTYIKRVILAIDSGAKETAIEAFKIATPIIDKMVNKRIIHKNKAARHKSRLAIRINQMAA